MAKIKHGYYKHRLYNVWKDMKRRCSNPKSKKYLNYGGRGISVCEGWLNAKNFIEWADTTYIEGMTLDRIDNDKGYSPENCRWTDNFTQQANKNKSRANTSGLIGVSWYKNTNRWSVEIMVNKRKIHLGYYLTKEEAGEVRNKYIIDNNLPHKLN